MFAHTESHKTTPSVKSMGIGNETTGGFQAGTSIEAIIYFDMEKQVSATGISAAFLGVENGEVKYLKAIGHHVFMATASAMRIILQVTIPINTSNIIHNGKVLIGKYVIPVTIQLPRGLPGSMIGTTPFGSNCNVQYNITAQLVGSGKDKDYKAYKANKEVPIVARLCSNIPIPYHKPPIQQKVNFCCCFNFGSVMFGARINNTWVSPGEAVTISMSCRNRSTVHIDSVTATLFQFICWEAEGIKTCQKEVLASQDFSTFSGLECNQSLSSISDVSADQDMQDIARDLVDAKYIAAVIAPSTMLASFTGSLIRVVHVLTVVANTGICINSPTITIPIQASTASAGPMVSYPQLEPVISSDSTNNAMSTSAVNIPGSQTHNGTAVYQQRSQMERTRALLKKPRKPNVEKLLLEMSESINDFGMIQMKIDHADWNSTFQTLSPVDFGTIIQKVQLDLDHAKVAELIASVVHDFRCDHVIAAIATCSEWNRAAIVKCTIPFCNDWVLNKDKIWNSLSEWDKLVTQKVFDKMLSHS